MLFESQQLDLLSSVQSSTHNDGKSVAGLDWTQLSCLRRRLFSLHRSTCSKVECGASACIITMWWSYKGVRRSKQGNKRKMGRTMTNVVCESLQFADFSSLGSWCSCWLFLRVSGLFWKEPGSPNTTDNVSSDLTARLQSTVPRKRLRSLDTFRG